MRQGHRLTVLTQKLLDEWQRGNMPRPGSMSTDDAGSISRALQLELDERLAEREEMAAERDISIACEPGCSYCCEQLIMVFKGEAIVVAQWLAEPENQDAREAFLEAYPTWRERVGDLPERAQAALVSGLGNSFRDVSIEAWQERVLCAFNRDGRCTVYPVRPNTCRACHALDSNEACNADNGQVPRTLTFKPIEEFRENTRTLTQAVHVAMAGQMGVLSSLCQEVHELLQGDVDMARTQRSDKVGRNDPCPCGSGAKFKRCCGR